MSAHLASRPSRRWLGAVGAATVIAMPIALIVATWTPLEPHPRPERPALVGEAATPERAREERRDRRAEDDSEDRAPRRDRDRADNLAPARATPRPGAGA